MSSRSVITWLIHRCSWAKMFICKLSNKFFFA